MIDEGKNIAEFHVKKEFRKNGIGKELARQITENPYAHSYWLKLIVEFTKNNFTEVAWLDSNI